ncbi:CBD9-like protein [Guyanagaster necrorhizus]|uniref:CBD9-like protein n=1 Tax=Guyanagaster necrorhizus TaxID=856835 RepID=A0A9P7VFJ6_9AGAR|nr:CBD9-like protein [Guyanagaster necrorhizus MCA 3950]KAG7439470.1 CBD9-like protein [Guyanagaster necrorhizus MCA 3950]
MISTNTTAEGDNLYTQSSVTGDSQCGTAMCVEATVNGTSIQYVLSSTETVGWMGMGFGTQMSGSPMVIMWSNTDGTITVSQREASGHTMPQVVSNPAQVATLAESASTTSGSETKFAFTVDANGDTTQNVIYAIGSTNPGSSSASATIQQHFDDGTFQLNLAGTLSATSTGSASSSGSTSGTSSSGTRPISIPLLPYQRMIVAHAILCVVGFLFFLPFGSLLARYVRTFTPKWYTGHWISQFAISGSLIIIGFALGVQSVTSAGALHLDDNHKQWGVAIFVIYWVQCALGAFIHWVKPKRPAGRPLQNYFHAVFGLFIIALAFYQVRTGYKTEWPSATGRGDIAKGADIVWYIWVVVPLLYFAGLAFLPKQYRQEAAAKGRYK